ncbi:hypothetical protein B0H14DRAFT_3441789 [Mycena olivaceomarginata]|nr:hypothetical protein B0H14DRAFT_3441789 [Mycena olivaceomarginata]
MSLRKAALYYSIPRSTVQDRAKGRLTPGRILTFINGICHSNLGIVPQQLPCIRVHRLTMRCEHLQVCPAIANGASDPSPFRVSSSYLELWRAFAEVPRLG